MVYKLLIRPLAANEIIDASDWYNEQKEGLGDKFIDELDSFFQKPAAKSICIFLLQQTS